jgi:hypothetical protein
MTPANSSVYQKYAIQSVNATKIAGTHFNLVMDKVDFFISTMKAGIMKDGQYVLDLDETICNTRKIPDGSVTGDLTQEISSSTYAITIAMQDSRAGRDTRYPLTKFTIENQVERNMTRFQLQYADESKPDPITMLNYGQIDANNAHGLKDYLTRRYMDTSLYNGMMWNGSPESYNDWLIDRGMYFFIPFPKDGSQTSTTMTLYYGFTTPTNGNDVANGNFLIFHHKKRLVRVRIEASAVTSVSVFDR